MRGKTANVESNGPPRMHTKTNFKLADAAERPSAGNICRMNWGFMKCSFCKFYKKIPQKAGEEEVVVGLGGSELGKGGR